MKDKDKGREVMLNGEIKENIKSLYSDGEPRAEFKYKTTRICLKAIEVQPLSDYEAYKSTYSL